MIEVYSAVVGIHFRPPEAKAVMDEVEIGDQLLLEPEPSNPYDSNAVRVIEPESGEFIGFLSRESNAEVAAHLAEDKPYYVEVLSFLAKRKPHVSIKLYEVDEPDHAIEANEDYDNQNFGDGDE